MRDKHTHTHTHTHTLYLEESLGMNDNGFRAYRRSFFEAFSIETLHKLRCFLSFKYEEAGVRAFLGSQIKRTECCCLFKTHARCSI